MTDVAAAVRDILALHLGTDEARIADDARLAEDLGADSLDAVEIFMSCEERFDIDILNRVAANLATVSDAVRFIEAQVAEAQLAEARIAEAQVAATARVPVASR